MIQRDDYHDISFIVNAYPALCSKYSQGPPRGTFGMAASGNRSQQPGSCRTRRHLPRQAGFLLLSPVVSIQICAPLSRCIIGYVPYVYHAEDASSACPYGASLSRNPENQPHGKETFCPPWAFPSPPGTRTGANNLCWSRHKGLPPRRPRLSGCGKHFYFFTT